MTYDGFSRSDEEMLEELALVLRTREAAPLAVVEAARSAFSWRTVAAVIAGLEFDSAVDDDDDLARVRDAGSERRLRFRGGDRVVEVVLVDNNSRLAGRIVPPLAGSVLLRHSGGATLSTPVNDLGQFFFDTLLRGAISLRPVPSDTTIGDFETEWVWV